MNISTLLPLWYNIFCVLLSLAVVIYLYRKALRFSELGFFQRFVPAFMRGLVVWLLAFFLLEPFVKHDEIVTEKPIILVATDISESMQADSLRLKDLQKYWFDFASEKETYEFHFVDFDEEVKASNFEHPLELSGNSTSISSLIHYVNDNYQYRNLGAVVMMTDGIYNQGLNPIYEEGLSIAPFYTIGFGDTNTYRDAALKDVKFNKVIGLNNTSPIGFSISTEGMKGASGEVKLFLGEDEIDSYRFAVNGTETFQKSQFNVNFDEPGLKKLRLVLTTNLDENRTENNAIQFFVDVKEEKKKILMLAAVPHPDLSAMMYAVSGNLNVSCELKYWNGTPIDFQKYDGVILHQLPSKKAPVGNLKELMESNLGVFVITGSRTDLRKFSNIQSWIHSDGLKTQMEEVLPVFNQDFETFKLDKTQQKSLIVKRPFLKPSIKFEIPSNADVLFKQQIGSVETPYPLMFTLEEGDKHLVFLLGEGWWQSRLAANKTKGKVNSYDDLLNKVLSYISQNESKERLKVLSSRKYRRGTTINIMANYFNSSHEPDGNQALNLRLKDEQGKEYDYVFNPINEKYQLEINGLNTGVYQYEVSVSGQPKIQKRGAFAVEDVSLEAQQTKADFGLLKSISSKSGGVFQFEKDFELFDVDTNTAALTSNSYIDSVFQKLIEFKLLFYVLLGLLTIEWLWRKWIGMI